MHAALAFELDEMVDERRDDGRNTYHQARWFVETAGNGVTLSWGLVCVEEACEEAEVNYRIEPNSSLIQVGHYVATLLPTDVITIEYSGVDDTGQPITFKRTLTAVEYSVE